MRDSTQSISIAVFAALSCLFSAPASAQTAPPSIYPPTQVNIGPINYLQLSASAGNIYYTLDGSNPSSGSILYQAYQTYLSNPGATQVNAIAINGGVSSPVVSAFYYIDDEFAFFPTPTSWYLNSFGPKVTGKVPLWPDLVNALNASQSTIANQPSILTNLITGLPAMSFSGSTYYQLPNATWSNSGITIFMVVNPTTLTPNAQLLNYSGATVPQNLLGVSESSANAPQFSIYNSAGTSATTVSGSSALVANKYQLVEVVQGDINNTTATIFVNGVQVGQNTAMNIVPSSTLTTNFIGQYSGGGQGFKGNIAEIILFATPLTTSQRVSLETFLLKKYNLLYQNPTAPIFSSASATFAAPSQVAISAQPGSTIRLTLDGTAPGITSPIYSAPLQINNTTTVKAIAVQNGLISSTTSATFSLGSQFSGPATGGPPLQINLTSPSLAIP